MLSADEVRQLDRLTFGSAGPSPAGLSGGRVARVRGFHTEFHDFRQYQPGDDPRTIEWTIFGRLGQLVTRTYRANAQLRVHLLVDVSASMGVGTPNKLSCAGKLAALLGYAALRSRDSVGLATFRATVTDRLAPSDGRSQLFRIFAALSGLAASGRSSIGAALMDYAQVERGPGVAVVISDFFDADGMVDGLRGLLHRGLTPAVVQVVSAEELDPPLQEDAELVDVEAPGAEPLIVGAGSVAAYKAALGEHQAMLRSFCDTHALPSLQIRSSASFPEMLHACSQAGLFVAQR
jgi:uncharacterized protein (DUF58 family)